MEEDIKILEELISWEGKNVEIRDYEIRAIQNLIARYKELENKNKSLKKEKEYYKKLYNESYNFLDPKFTGDHIPRID